MRISPSHAQQIRLAAQQLAGADVQARVFGSRLDDNATGGDIDIVLQIPHPVDNPAWLAAQFSARASRVVEGRKVDVLIVAPNLQRLSIHDNALSTGQLL
jgi:predicted nucleotidyltransferase